MHAFFPWNMRDPAFLGIVPFGEMPVDLVAGMVALSHQIEWDYFAQLTREELE